MPARPLAAALVCSLTSIATVNEDWQKILRWERMPRRVEALTTPGGFLRPHHAGADTVELVPSKASVRMKLLAAMTFVAACVLVRHVQMRRCTRLATQPPTLDPIIPLTPEVELSLGQQICTAAAEASPTRRQKVQALTAEARTQSHSRHCALATGVTTATGATTQTAEATPHTLRQEMRAPTACQAIRPDDRIASLPALPAFAQLSASSAFEATSPAAVTVSAAHSTAAAETLRQAARSPSPQHSGSTRWMGVGDSEAESRAEQGCVVGLGSARSRTGVGDGDGESERVEHGRGIVALEHKASFRRLLSSPTAEGRMGLAASLRV